MKKKWIQDAIHFGVRTKTWKIMRLCALFLFLFLSQVWAESGYSQQTKLTLKMNNVRVIDVLDEIENNSEFYFLFNQKLVDVERKVNVDVSEKSIDKILTAMFAETDVNHYIQDRLIILTTEKTAPNTGQTIQQQKGIRGTVVDKSGKPIPGATVVVKGTIQGTVTDINGEYSISEVPENATLQFSFVGMRTQEVVVHNQATINITMEVDAIGIEEVVAIGYGTMKKSDLTGSVVRANLNSFSEAGNTSVLQSLQGSVSGMEVSKATTAGQESSILVRGNSSINGESEPLVVLDGVIYRGKIIDINPNDIESVDVLKDASSAAIYGSQAANGVIIITTKSGKGLGGKPVISYSGYYSFQNPVNELKPGGTEDFYRKSEWSDIFNSRTEESGYLDKNPDWDITSNMKTTNEINAYNDGRSSNWYNLVTNDYSYTHGHNLSLSNRTKYSRYLISLGYTSQQGYMVNDDYDRVNARINIDNDIKDWLTVGIQSFMTHSDYSGITPSVGSRYTSPYAVAYDTEGEYVPIPTGLGANSLMIIDADDLDTRLELFGNIYADVKIPFIKGLKYKVNFSNTYNTSSNYYYKEYESDFQGEASKEETKLYDYSVDNILNYQRRFNKIHNVNIMIGYGIEKRKYNSTTAQSSVFASDELGYNSLEVGSADMQYTFSDAWEESSLYSMARLIYGYNNRYLFTGTIRRDGFSGFSDENKFGVFPSASAAWVISEEEFMQKISWLDNLKFRFSFGSVGNRTIGRYQTLAVVDGGYNYVNGTGTSVYTQYISSLESANLKWETTTGINLGLDFSILSQRLWGSVDYYNNNTKDLLYNVDIPGMSGYTNFPDNLGKIHNHGIEITLNSINIKVKDFEWGSSLIYSRSRNELKELLGYDNDGDGKEDDLISEGLFIGKSLGAIYDYTIDGFWQVGDDIPSGYDLGSNKVVDISGDGEIDADDKSILGYSEPSYTISMNNYLNYKNWSLNFFITSIQGGKNGYMADNTLLDFQIKNQENHFNINFPKNIDYWKPENPDATYQRPNIVVSDGIQGIRYSQRNFIRLQSVSLSYKFSNIFNNKYGLSNLKVYVSGKNLITISDWNGWDPETGEGITPNGLPVMKSFTMGLNVEF